MLIIERTIPEELKLLLEKFIRCYLQNGLSPYAAALFYKFIIASYEQPRKNRYGISMLAAIFNKNHMSTALLVNIYTHSIYCLALKDNKNIYKEFII